MKRENKLGFTLMEMLVVVTIMAILAAIALPKYQAAVINSKYITLKRIVRQIVEAEERHYLGHREYVFHPGELGLPITSNGTYKGRTKVYCYVGKNNADKPKYVYCKDNTAHIGYEENFIYGGGTPSIKYCMLYDGVDSNNSIQAKICQRESGLSSPTSTSATSIYYYWTDY